MFDGFTPFARLLIATLPLVACVGLLAVVVLSCRFPGFAQFMKYGSIGVMATYVQTGVFYLLATTCLLCLKADDVAVVQLGFPAAAVSDAARAWRFAVATSVGFVIANAFCWLMNRWFVFRPGKFRWYVELGMFFATSATATAIALGLSAALISFFGLMTTLAVLIEVVVSFMVNYFVRKFFIFKG